MGQRTHQPVIVIFFSTIHGQCTDIYKTYQVGNVRWGTCLVYVLSAHCGGVELVLQYNCSSFPPTHFMIEKDRETIVRQRAAEAADADIRSGRLSTSQLVDMLHTYIRTWSHAVVYSGIAKDGQPYRCEMETVILPKSKIVMGLSREYFGDRLESVQRESIRSEYRLKSWMGRGRR